VHPEANWTGLIYRTHQRCTRVSDCQNFASMNKLHIEKKTLTETANRPYTIKIIRQMTRNYFQRKPANILSVALEAVFTVRMQRTVLLSQFCLSVCPSVCLSVRQMRVL